MEKELLAVKEKSKAIKDKLEKEYKRTRRVRTGNTGGLFREERSQDQYAIPHLGRSPSENILGSLPGRGGGGATQTLHIKKQKTT